MDLSGEPEIKKEPVDCWDYSQNKPAAAEDRSLCTMKPPPPEGVAMDEEEDYTPISVDVGLLTDTSNMGREVVDRLMASERAQTAEANANLVRKDDDESPVPGDLVEVEVDPGLVHFYDEAGKKRFPCTKCEVTTSFSTPGNLKNHIQSVHSGKKFRFVRSFVVIWIRTLFPNIRRVTFKFTAQSEEYRV